MRERIALVGCGLIGCSFASALRTAGRVDTVVGFDRDPSVAEEAVRLGLVDRAAPTIADAASDATFVVVATPVAQAASVLAQLKGSLASDAIVTDVGSTKRDVIAAARATLGDAFARFVPGHPIAGRERHGPEAADAGLFQGRRVLLTPVAETDAEAIDRVTAVWSACGAIVNIVDADVHDVVLSAVSHLPHLLAYVLVAQIADAPDAALKFSLAGGGFRDFTRIAASSPDMWCDIALANAAPLLDDLDAYRARLDALRACIADADGATMKALFEKASAARIAWNAGD